MGSTLAGFSLVFALLGIVIAILWILLPFLVMGTNSRLDKLIKQNEELLRRMERPVNS